MKNLFKCLLLASCLLFTGIAFAESATFTQEGFNQLQKEGKSILVEVHAPWCPTCRAQAPVVNMLLAKKEFKKIVALRLDFDSQKEELKKLKVNRQSTLIVFKDGKEVGRSLGDTTPSGIETLLQKSL